MKNGCGPNWRGSKKAERARREEERRRRAWEERQRQAREAAAAKGPVNPYREALMLVGLSEPFTKKAFIKAYRKAMMTAHPDAGGTTWEAQAVNAARDLIKRRNGW